MSEINWCDPVALASRLIEAPSPNPPGDELAAADVALQLVRGLQPVRVLRLDGMPSRPNLIVDVTSRSGKPRLIFNAHLDVTASSTERWSTPPNTPTVSDGRLYGAGASDMKGGLAAVIAALSRVRAAGHEIAWDVELHLVADEERGGRWGTAVLAEAGLLSGDLCLIAEPTTNVIVPAERGVVWAEFEFCCQAEPAAGLMTLVGEVLAGFGTALTDHTTHELAGARTINIGMITGGATPNARPGSVTLGIDIRLLPADRPDEVVHLTLGRLRTLAQTVHPSLRVGCRITKAARGSETSIDHPAVRLLRHAAKVTLGADQVGGYPGPTDARFYRWAGQTPTVVFGPGDPGLAHKPNEYVSVDALRATTAMLELLLTDKRTAAQSRSL